jgi:TatD DNase family protein
MLIDTHCHLNMLIKKEFDIPLTNIQIDAAQKFIDEAKTAGVTKIINVGTAVIESQNCIELAKKYSNLWATVGLHPNDLEATWEKQLEEIKNMVANKQTNKICGIGEIGMDKHYPKYDINRQTNAFKKQIELALENDLAIVVHNRDAGAETLKALREYKGAIKHGIIHCFSEDLDFAKEAIDLGFHIGIGGTITYPKNDALRKVVQEVSLDNIVLETDTPFLPPQEIRGQKNTPAQIKNIAQYIAHLKKCSLEKVATKTTTNAEKIFKI